MQDWVYCLQFPLREKNEDTFSYFMGYGNHAFTIIFIHEGAWKHAETTVYILGQFKLVNGPFGLMNMPL